jgi:hypothetical protein
MIKTTVSAAGGALPKSNEHSLLAAGKGGEAPALT